MRARRFLLSVASARKRARAENGRFCMGILVTLSLSNKKALIGLKIFLIIDECCAYVLFIKFWNASDVIRVVFMFTL